jgi:hypothetical protein
MMNVILVFILPLNSTRTLAIADGLKQRICLVKFNYCWAFDKVVPLMGAITMRPSNCAHGTEVAEIRSMPQTRLGMLAVPGGAIIVLARLKRL